MGRGARGGGGSAGGAARGPGGRTHIGFPGQLLHNFRLQLAVGFPHLRAAAAPAPRARPRRGTQRERLGRGGARGGAGGPGRGRAFVCAGPAGPGHGGTVRQAPGQSGRRPLRAPRRGAALGWAPTRPRCRRGRPWLPSPRHMLAAALRLRRRPCAPASCLRTGALGWTRSRHSAPGATSRPRTCPPGRAFQLADRRPRGAPSRAGGGASPPTPGFIGPRAGRARSPQPLRHLPRRSTALRPLHPTPPRAEPGRGGPGSLTYRGRGSGPETFIHSTRICGALGMPRNRTGGPSPSRGEGRGEGTTGLRRIAHVVAGGRLLARGR